MTDRHVIRISSCLCHVAYFTPVFKPSVYRHITEINCTAVGHHKPEYRFNERGFSRCIRTDQCNAFSFFYIGTQPVKGFQAAVFFYKQFGFQDHNAGFISGCLSTRFSGVTEGTAFSTCSSSATKKLLKNIMLKGISSATIEKRL